MRDICIGEAIVKEEVEKQMVNNNKWLDGFLNA